MMGKRICSLREGRGLTQEQLALQLNISQQSIDHYEKGRAVPKLDTLKKMASFFGVSIDYLTGASDEKNPEMTTTQKEFLILARHAEMVPEEARKELQKTISDTIDVYLARTKKQ